MSTTWQPIVENPLVEGLDRPPVHPASLVIFGATGDLTRRKLLPAIYNLAHEGSLPERFNLVGVSRRDIGDDGLREMAREAVRHFSRRSPDEQVLARLLENARYVAGQLDDPETYRGLEDALGEFDAQANQRLNRCIYLATAPVFFPVIVEQLGASGLNRLESADVRIVIEKPFGTTLIEAAAKYQEVRDNIKDKLIK